MCRFAETEGVAALSILVSQYKITVKEEPQFAAETFEERKTRVLAARVGLTTTWVLFLCGWFKVGDTDDFFFLPLFFVGLFVFLWFSLVVHEVNNNIWGREFLLSTVTY